jgi:hypothetical protein
MGLDIAGRPCYSYPSLPPAAAAKAGRSRITRRIPMIPGLGYYALKRGLGVLSSDFSESCPET